MVVVLHFFFFLCYVVFCLMFLVAAIYVTCSGISVVVTLGVFSSWFFDLGVSVVLDIFSS